MTQLLKNTQTTVNRLPERGHYDRPTANAILDEGLVCHVGVHTADRVVVIPMAYARMGWSVLLHGSVASRLLQTLENGLMVCATVTLIDGIVLARSVFSHSMNYRSIVMFGIAKPVTDLDEKREALRALTEHLSPGRWEDARQPTRKELLATRLLRLPLNEASVKIRSGPPHDLKKDLDLDVWAGVVPLSTQAHAPIPDPDGNRQLAIPDYLENYMRQERHS